MSVYEAHKALYEFWAGFDVPAFLSGHVPQGTALPYITFEVVSEEPFATNFLTAFDWHQAQSGINVNAERAQMMDRIAQAIPPEGVLLPLTGGGYLELLRNGSGFQSYYDDPEDATIIGGRTSVQVNFYSV